MCVIGRSHLRGVRFLGCATPRLSAPRAEAARVHRVPRVCVDGVPRLYTNGMSRVYVDAMNCVPPGVEWRSTGGGRVATCCDRTEVARIGRVASGRSTRSARRHGDTERILRLAYALLHPPKRNGK